MQVLTENILTTTIRQRPADSYKGTYGRVTLIGGNRNFGGAIIMASAAANSALGTEVLAVQRLFYNITPNPAASILYVTCLVQKCACHSLFCSLLFSSQLLGYGIGGLFRSKQLECQIPQCH